MPVEKLVDHYDLVTIDHPYMGQAHANHLFLPLESHLPESFLTKLAAQSVGPSFRSYFYQSHLYALPIDAAALVSAYRNDLIDGCGLMLPNHRGELFDFYQKVPKQYSVAWPLCPTDLWCSFLTICVQDGGAHVIREHSINEKAGSKALDELKRHLEYLHPDSIHWNPIDVLNYMSEEDDVIYAPYLFGYSNYARAGFVKNLLQFNNSPTNPENSISTILGGVGLAISSNCKHIDMAVAYLSYVASAETQKGLYTQSGGQPASLSAWQSPSNNELCNHFFSNTLQTMERAFVRPQHPGWNQFQEQGAALLHRGLIDQIPSGTLMKNLNQLYKSTIRHEQEV